jgi:hypothetical protein
MSRQVGRCRAGRLLITSLILLVAPVCVPFGERSSAQSAPSAKAQSDAPHGPDYVPYEILFRRIVELDARADQLDAQGKTAAAASQRTQMQRAIGLSDQEGAMLRHIAAENNAELKENAEKIKAAKLEASRAPEVADLLDDQEEIVRDHMGQLQTGLGDEACRKIDAYVKRMAKSSPRKPASQGTGH